MTTLADATSNRAREKARRRALRGASAAVLAAVILVAAAGPAPRSTPFVGTHARLAADRISTLSTERLEHSAVAWLGGPTTAATGEPVTVYVSASLPSELGTPQTWADFIAGLLHGPELSALTAYIAMFDEMQQICGEHALGCYSANRMVSMGETMFGVTAAEVIRHEYGHHVAMHRLNTPWPAITWGPKTWATSQDVCRRAEAGSAYPGDQGERYFLNPGEAWAETYRLLDERRAGTSGSGWHIIDSSFHPDDADLEAAERDVVAPWSGPRTTTYRSGFTSARRVSWVVRVDTPRDGSIELTVSLPRGGLHDVSLLDAKGKRVLATGLWAGQTVKRVSTTVCGQRTLVLRVTHRGAFGNVKVTARVP